MNYYFFIHGNKMEELRVVCLHQYSCSWAVEHFEGGCIKEQIKWAEAHVATLEVENNKEMGMNGAVLRRNYKILL